MDGEQFVAMDQPFVTDLLKRMRELQGKPGLHHTIIEHDDWCPLLLGTGPCICRPVVRSPNRAERRRMKKKKGN